ncbi:MAG: DnaJ domain-containing protein [Pseudomonadota bacterium]|nr:DnaJ domain-containing protein [Pseudomonadota bacterium]
MKKNLYDLLEVSPDADSEEIKAAMMRLGKIYATKGQTNEVARAHFNQIKEAYKILSHPYRRAIYDDGLKKKPVTEATPPQQQSQLTPWLKKKWYILKSWRVNKQQLLNQFKAGEQHARHSWQQIKNRTASRYISQALIPDEKMMYQAVTHWFFYVDLGAILLVALSSYLLVKEPYFFTDNMPTVMVWLPQFLSSEALLVSVWQLGLASLIFIGLMMLWEALIAKQTTELAVTSKRIMAKFGLLNRNIVELKLRRFESIHIEQSFLGLIFDYGTVTITGMGGVKTTIPHIMAPAQFKKVLWYVLEQVEVDAD